jgi:hypothetical protein
LNWGNITSALRWNHVFHKKLFGNLTAVYSKYKFETIQKYEFLSGKTIEEEYYFKIFIWN